jgi:hypothetical protein
VSAMTPSSEAEGSLGGGRSTRVPTRRNAIRVVAASVAGVVAAALLGWLTAYGVGLTGPSAATGSTIEALPSAPPQAEPWAPAFGQTLDLDDARAGRAARPSPAEGTPTARRAPVTPSASSAAPRPTAAPRSEPTPAAVRIVRQGDPCTIDGAVAQTRAGAAAVCTTTPGNGRMRWRRA